MNMFKRLVLLSAVAVSCLSAAALPGRVEKGDTVRILAVGNSFSQDAIEQYFYELAAADSIYVIVGNLYYGGCSLQQHFEFLRANKPAYEYRKVMNGVKVNTPRTTLDEALADEDWDFVSFQQASHYSGMPETYEPYLSDLTDYVRAKVRQNTEFAFHMTWAYSEDSTHGGFKNYDNSQTKMYEAILAATKHALSIGKFGILVPCGTAVQNARTSELGDTMCRDGYHLQLVYGRYTAACTWFEAVLGHPVTGNAYAPAGISEYQKRVAQEAAHTAVEKPFDVTAVR